MNLPTRMREMLDEESPEFRALFKTAYEQVEGLGLRLHPQGTPNVIAEHPKNGINCVALWIKGRKGDRRIEGEVRVDGYPVDILSIRMRDELTIHKYDRDKSPLWFLLHIGNSEDLYRFRLITKRVIAVKPDWGRR
jgi:hypothetical protein